MPRRSRASKRKSSTRKSSTRTSSRRKSSRRTSSRRTSWRRKSRRFRSSRVATKNVTITPIIVGTTTQEGIYGTLVNETNPNTVDIKVDSSHQIVLDQSKSVKLNIDGTESFARLDTRNGDVYTYIPTEDRFAVKRPGSDGGESEPSPKRTTVGNDGHEDEHSPELNTRERLVLVRSPDPDDVTLEEGGDSPEVSHITGTVVGHHPQAPRDGAIGIIPGNMPGEPPALSTRRLNFDDS